MLSTSHGRYGAARGLLERSVAVSGGARRRRAISLRAPRSRKTERAGAVRRPQLDAACPAGETCLSVSETCGTARGHAEIP